MRAQTNVISVVLIAGIVIALVGGAYVWAVPMIEKRMTVTDYSLVESFMLDLNQEIVDIANAGSGEALLEIPRGTLEALGYGYPGSMNNSVTLDFRVSQPIMAEGSVPIRTSSLAEVAEYGKSEPRVIVLSRTAEESYTHLNMSMRYRELRSSTPKGYMIALCPARDCDGRIIGGSDVRLSYWKTAIVPRDFTQGGDMTVTYINIEAS